MAPKVPPKALKPQKKAIEKPIVKPKKPKKKNYQSFSIYLYKLFRTIDTKNPLGISRRSMLILNHFVYDMLEKIATEAGRVTNYGKKNTLGSREIHTAIRLLLPEELAKHTNIEGTKALAMYRKNIAQREMRNKDVSTE